MDAATFAAVFIALYVAHSVGDHWIQTSHQAAAKGQNDGAGRRACAAHVLTLTAMKVACLGFAEVALSLPVTALGAFIGLAVDAASHYWADRRTTLAKLAKLTGKAEFHSLGTGTHPAAPVTAEGGPAAHLGTGAYALDQSWHHLWLLVAALLITLI